MIEPPILRIGHPVVRVGSFRVFSNPKVPERGSAGCTVGPLFIPISCFASRSFKLHRETVTAKSADTLDISAVVFEGLSSMEPGRKSTVKVPIALEGGTGLQSSPQCARGPSSMGNGRHQLLTCFDPVRVPAISSACAAKNLKLKVLHNARFTARPLIAHHVAIGTAMKAPRRAPSPPRWCRPWWSCPFPSSFLQCAANRRCWTTIIYVA